MIRLKSKEEVAKIERAAKIVAEVLDLMSKMISSGISAYNLERAANELIEKRNAKPAFKGYNGFPYALCVSVNEEIVHGFPLKNKVFKRGDIVSIDCGVIKEEYYGDAARTFCVDQCSEDDKRLMRITEEALEKAIEVAVPGKQIGDIGAIVQAHVEDNGFSVIRDYVGHGVGRKLHEDPQIPNYGRSGTGDYLRNGMTLAIEPMVSAGDYRTMVLEDGWTAVTIDGSKTAHFENTLVIENDSTRVLSKL
ncbi:MAG: type I methionyl aminopeptidase [Kosmotogaceae bacterium]